MDNWKLPDVNSSLNVWGIALWQHTISAEVTTRTLWSIKYKRSAMVLRIRLCENKRKRSLVRIPSFFSIVFLWATRRRGIGRIWHLHSIYPILAAGRYLAQFCTYQNWQCLIEIRISRHVSLRRYLKCKVVPKTAKLKHTLMYKCTTFSASTLFHQFFLSARSGSIRYHNALPNKTSSDCTSYYLDGLMHSVFAESLNLSEVKDSGTQI